MKTDNLLIVVAICIVVATALHDYIDHLNRKAEAALIFPKAEHQSSPTQPQPITPLT